ncbi:hydroxymethylbilane synthase [Rickettsia endosymbiont of Nabis limbatus]|uniref:hydroxymethylbilane synthase n=1 Tax=Rickettsia endosymbiont of Nabis limbatus TaxID=3066268 RepID=UPI0030E14E90
MINSIRIGTRKSKLALTQTKLVIEQIKQHFPNINCEIVEITTSGDLIQNKPLYDIGGKALFLKEIEQALLDKKIDLAVHSLKDVPGIIPEDLSIEAVLEREDSRDVFVCLTHKSIEELPKNAVIGTSSVRRKLCVQRIRPDLEIVMFRGNVDSRINKLINKEVDATILAYAGLKRLNAFNPEYCHLIEHSQMLPCIGQGVIAIEIRKDNHAMIEICKQINHLPTFELIKPERALLEYLDANCRTPIGAYSKYLDNGDIQTDFMLGNLDGSKIAFHTEISNTRISKEAGIKAAKVMLFSLSQ